MTISRFLYLSVTFLALIACSLGAMVAVQNWSALERIAATSARLSVMKALANIPSTINPERGLASLQFSTVAPGNTSQRATLLDIRRLTDAAFAEARAKLALLDGRVPEAAKLSATTERLITSWIDERKTSDQALAETPVDKRADALASAIDANVKINAAISVIMRDEQLAIADVSGVAYRFADVANTAWELRDVAGRQAGLLQNYVAAAKPVSADARATITKFEGQVQQVWSHLANLPETPGTPDNLKSAILAVKSAYIDTIGAEKAKVIAGFDTGTFPYDAAEFRTRFNVPWPIVIGLRDAGFAAALDQISKEEANLRQEFYIAVLASLIALIMSIVVGLLVRTRVTKPIAAITDSMTHLAAGQLDQSIPGLGRADEVGGMAKALEIFKDGLVRNRALELAAAQERSASADRRKALMVDLAASFETSVGGIVRSVSASARDLESAARNMSQTASETSNRSTSVAAAAEEASTNVSAVASSAEELGSSVSEISRQVQQSSEMSKAAVHEANETAAIVKELASSASKISDVLGLISTIAGQTNLLALNATIEAARAGDAGRGFAIVASEVKELANQTAKATSDISAQITAIQSSTERAVGAIGGIANTIQSMNAVAAAISASVEQQGLATSEIVRTIGQASSGTEDVTSNIGAVARAAQESGAVAEQVLSASGTLSGQADNLRKQVDHFLETVRAA